SAFTRRPHGICMISEQPTGGRVSGLFRCNFLSPACIIKRSAINSCGLTAGIWASLDHLPNRLLPLFRRDLLGGADWAEREHVWRVETIVLGKPCVGLSVFFVVRDNATFNPDKAALVIRAACVWNRSLAS